MSAKSIDDLTNRQLLDLMTEQLAKQLTEQLSALETRLERKIKASHTANIRHHLETRKQIGSLSRQFTNLRDGLARAVQ